MKIDEEVMGRRNRGLRYYDKITGINWQKIGYRDLWRFRIKMPTQYSWEYIRQGKRRIKIILIHLYFKVIFCFEFIFKIL